MAKLDWKKILDDQCPQCGDPLNRASTDDFKCVHCGFFMARWKGNQIKEDMKWQKQQKEKDKAVDAIIGEATV